MLMTTYSAGLRASEVVALKPNHIESNKMLINVQGGKGGKDRYSLLSIKLLKELRDYYKTCRPRSYLFPSSNKHKKQKPLCYESLRSIYENARKKAGVKKGAGIHTLRHPSAGSRLWYPKNPGVNGPCETVHHYDLSACLTAAAQ